MPFFVYGINKRTKETAEKLDTTNALLSEILEELKKR